MEKTKIFLVDDKQVYRNAIKILLNKIGDAKIVGEAASGEEFLKKIDNAPKPDVVFMDIEMPGLDGIETTRKALARNPDLSVIGLSMYDNQSYIENLMKAGAKGYLLKLSDNTEVLQKIIEYPDAEVFFSKEIVYDQTKKEVKQKEEKSTILCAEDFKNTRHIIEYVLKKADYNVLLAENGGLAWQMLQENDVDLVITDYNMPEISGIELTKKIRSEYKNRQIPVLLLTTNISPGKKQEAKNAGVTGWLQKPFKMDTFLSYIKKALR